MQHACQTIMDQAKLGGGDAPPFSRVRVLGLNFDQIGQKAAAAYLWDRPAGAPYSYVTSPNVDHVVRLHGEVHSAEIDQAYHTSDLTLCDSKVMALLARWYGIHLAVATGSDITADLLERLAHSNEPVVIIGGDAETIPALAKRYGLTNMCQHIPPMGLMQSEVALDAAARFIVENRARFIFICVGSPQQEVIALRARKMGAESGLALCVGASLDYLTGRIRRAPMIFRWLALEWLYRLLREPHRMWRRYLIRSPKIFSLLRGDVRQRRRPAKR